MKFRPTDVNGWLSSLVTAIGPSPFMQLRSGPSPATTAAAATGTLINEIAMPASPFSTPASALITKVGTWASNSVDVGVIGHGRILNNAKTTCFWTGSVTQAVAYALTATAGGNTYVLTVADTSGIVRGAGISGAGIKPNTVVADLTATTITLSQVLNTSMASGSTIIVGDTSGDMLISGAYIPTVGTTVTVFSWSMGWPDLI